jgi:hypothetical protein
MLPLTPTCTGFSADEVWLPIREAAETAPGWTGTAAPNLPSKHEHGEAGGMRGASVPETKAWVYVNGIQEVLV